MSQIKTEVEKYIKRTGKKLTASDFNPLIFIIISHGDGTSYQFTNAIYHNILVGNNEAIVIFTEHNGYHWFLLDDLIEENGVKIYQRQVYSRDIHYGL